MKTKTAVCTEKLGHISGFGLDVQHWRVGWLENSDYGLHREDNVFFVIIGKEAVFLFPSQARQLADWLAQRTQGAWSKRQP